MKRRMFVAGLGLLPFIASARADDGWHAQLVIGGFDGADFWAGLVVTLGEGWKTYWRVPGEAGIPPQIKVSGGDVTGFEVLYPLPQRIVDDSGEAIGYHNRVMFPLRISTAKSSTSIAGNVSAFFGVCQQICKPAKFEGDLSGAWTEADFIRTWRALVPKPGSFVTAVGQQKDVLTLKLSQPVDDIFIEGPDGLYFRKPEINGSSAQVKIDGLTAGQKLKGTQLKFTAAMHGKGLEQAVAVA
jgi:DsbC/DsbD-like thiol-disulfide interchange protein